MPLSRRIVELLDDYEARPDHYHDGSLREPKNAQKRDDYTRYYRNQAQSYLTAAYTSLGESRNMMEAYAKIERSVREVVTREHLARYDALQQQMEASRQQAHAARADIVAAATAIVALLLLALAIVFIVKNRTISRKNRFLAQEIAEAVSYKQKYMEQRHDNATQTVDSAPQTVDTTNPSALSDEQLFRLIDETIIGERLFLKPDFGRQTLIDRFHISKERVGTLISNYSKHTKLNSYIQQLRLEYAAKLLTDQPDKTIVQIAIEKTKSLYTKN